MDESKHWHYGFNMPGYMPDTTVIATDNWEVAYDSLEFDLDSHLESDWHAGDISWAMTDDIMVEVAKFARFGKDFYYEYGKYVYWIEACDSASCSTEEKELEEWLATLTS